MGRPLSKRGIRLDKRCCREYSAWREPACANYVSISPEYPSPIKKLYRHMASPVGIARQSYCLADACFP